MSVDAHTVEWLLILGDVGIPELAAEIPPQFQQLISNLKENEEPRQAVCVGSLGTDGSRLVEYLTSLVGGDVGRVHVCKALLPATPINPQDDSNQELESVPEKDLSIFEVGGIKVGCMNGQQVSWLGFPRYNTDVVEGQEETALPQQGALSYSLAPPPALLFGQTIDLVICQRSGGGPHVWRLLSGEVVLCPGSVSGRRLFCDSPGPVAAVSSVTMSPTKAESEVPSESQSAIESPQGEDIELEAQRMTQGVAEQGDGREETPSFMLLRSKGSNLSLFIYRLHGEEVLVEKVELDH